MRLYTNMRWRVATAFFFMVAAVGAATANSTSSQTVASSGSTSVSKDSALGAILPLLRDDRRPFADVAQQQSLLDTLLDLQTIPPKAQTHFRFDEKERGFIARQSGEATLRAIAQLVDFRLRDIYTKDAPTVLARARELYLASPNEFSAPATYEVSHIVVRTDNRSLSEAVERATAAYEALKTGATFAEISAKYSDDPSAKENKGRLPPLSFEQVDSAFAKNTFAEKNVEKLLPPFIGRSGIHVVYVHRHNASVRLTFEKARDAAIARAIDDMVASARSREWQAIKDDATNRRYDFSQLGEYVKPPVDPARAQALQREALRIKAEQQAQQRNTPPVR